MGLDFLQNTDIYRSIPKEFRKTTELGGALTLCTYAIIALLLVAELSSFLTSDYTYEVTLDKNAEKTLSIDFDILMHDLPCKFLRITAFDTFGEERVDTDNTKAFSFIPITDGQIAGKPYTNEEVELLERDQQSDNFQDQQTMEELESDWAKSDDAFKHSSFNTAVTFHEFTFVMFYADWCSHCREFHPTWDEMVKQYSMTRDLSNKFTDETGRKVNLKMMKINCVDFEKTCEEQRIMAFPSLVMYTDRFAMESGSIKPEPFVGHRNKQNVVKFFGDFIAKTHKKHAEYHSMFSQGCQVVGHLDVPRVPGEFHVEVNAHNIGSDINPKVLNVSHTINYLSFGRPNHVKDEIFKWHIPAAIAGQMTPLNGKKFITQHFHEAPQHYLKVVSTMVGSSTTYQFTHSDHLSSLATHDAAYNIPQAKFLYDLSPLAVELRPKAKKWYEFLTSMCALLGGAYTVAKLTSRTVIRVVGKKDV